MKTARATGRPKDHQLSSVQVLRVVSTRPQYYYSVRIDQRQQRAIHVLPEKYQFCSLGAARPIADRSSSPTAGFGRCRAKVHYGLCTDFDVFVVNESTTGGQAPASPALSSTSSSSSRFTYSVKKMPAQTPITAVMTRPFKASSTNNSSSQSHPQMDRSITNRIERYRENIGAALEILNEYDEPAQLQSLIRNFVRQDRLRQETGPPPPDPSIHELDLLEQKLLEAVESATTELDSKGRKITLNKPQADLLQRLQHQKGLKLAANGQHSSSSQQQLNHTSDVFASENPAPFLSTNREGVVQSRLVRFGSRESSPSPTDVSSSVSPSSTLISRNGTVDVGLELHSKRPSSQDITVSSNSIVHNNEKTVFGISPKSSSLSRYKNLIESRSSGASSPVNFGIGIELANLTDGQASPAVNGGDKYYPNGTASAGSLYSASDPTAGISTSQAANRREPFLEITSGANLDSSHRGAFAGSGSNRSGAAEKWKQQSAGIIFGDVNDTAKCIAVDACTASSTPSYTSAPTVQRATSPSPSSSQQAYLSSPGASTSAVSTSLPSTAQQQQSTHQFAANSRTQHSPSGESPSPAASSPYQRVTSSPLRSDSPRSSSEFTAGSSVSPLRHSPSSTIYASGPGSGSSADHHDHPNSIDAFIQENEQFFKSGNKLSRSVGVIEEQLDYVDSDSSDGLYENMKIKDNKLSSLTDDEKALLHETLKAGLYTGDPKKRQMLHNGAPNGLKADSADENCDPNQTAQLKPNRRIIFVSKPAPKPEPKPEPKYVNGKVVFGQMPVKPVLQKGSVAERVMLFEKCPEKTSVTKNKLTELQKSRITNPNKIGNWVRSGVEKDVKIPKIANNSGGSGASSSVSLLQKGATRAEEPRSPTIASVPTFRRFSRSNSLTGTLPGQLPRFYFPNGRPYSSHEVETQIKRIIGVFERFPSRSVTRKDFGGVLKLVGIPVYWKEPLFRAVLASAKHNGIGLANGSMNGTLNGSRRGSRSNSIDLTNGKNGFASNGKKEYISCEQFTDYWKRVITTCYDDAARFMHIVTEGKRNFMLPEDLESLIQDVIDTHPGLLFLKEAEEFHSRYVHTVIARVFYCLDKTWSGTITLPELRKSNFLKIMQLLEEEEDINQITEYFSYEHFYVIYCKFWELDQDHDLFISKYDLARHNDSAISSRMIDRIFSGAVTRGPRNHDNQMSYAEFVWFLLSEEDKRHPRAIEYWFRCMDLDGDGALSMYELEYFYSEQVKRMEASGIEALPFTDCLCQMIDLASPQDPLRITLNDLKRCRLTPVFFDTFFNLEKYLDHEQRDPFASQRDEDGLSMSDWDRYAAEEYEMLVAEENAQNGSNRFYSSYGHSSTRHRYPTEEAINLDEYDEDEEEEEASGDSDSQNEYECEEMQQDFAQENSSQEESNSDSLFDSQSEDSLNGGDSGEVQSAPTEAAVQQLTKSSHQSSSSSSASPRFAPHSSLLPSDDIDIDEIGREFYEYINAEFATTRAVNNKSPPAVLRTVERYPLNPNDCNNNPVAVPLDDEDFW